MTTLEVTLDLPDRMAREAQAAGAARADLIVTGNEDLLGEPKLGVAFDNLRFHGSNSPRQSRRGIEMIDGDAVQRLEPLPKISGW